MNILEYVSVDWTSAESIRAAELAKERLENKGYTLANSFGGMFYSTSVYVNKQHTFKPKLP